MATTPSTQVPADRAPSSRRPMLIGKGWVQAVALVMIFGFFVMGILAYRTYTASMPMPTKVVQSGGGTLFTGQDISDGQELFEARGLMEYGSIMGHGGYVGPDFTADYLRRSTQIVDQRLRQAGTQDPQGALIEQFRTNRHDLATGVLTFTPDQAAAYEQLTKYYAQFFGTDAATNGLKADAISDGTQISQLTAFFAWTSWASAATRPGHDYSYTNNWPPEPAVNNHPTADLIVWSGLSLIALIGGTGVLFALYGRWSRRIGWHSEEAPTIVFRQPGEVGLTKSQRTTAWFFLVISLLFLIQTLVGALAEHYRAELSNFFGIDIIATLLPFNLARTWHLQLALFWTVAEFWRFWVVHLWVEDFLELFTTVMVAYIFVMLVENYVIATSQNAQTTLRSVLGRADLDTLLAHRDDLNAALREITETQTRPWGVDVSVVEIKDVEIPEQMQRAMAKEAEAERERRAKVINARGELQASEELRQAFDTLSRSPAALQLRYLQTLLELGADQNSTVVFPLPMDIIGPLLSRLPVPGGDAAAAGATPAMAPAAAATTAADGTATPNAAAGGTAASPGSPAPVSSRVGESGRGAG